MSDCIHCHSTDLRKNGRLKSGGQRWKCGDCAKQFSIGGARDTYTPEFKKEVVDQYCHSPSKAKEVLQKYGISSRTLIKWKKEHTQDCKICV